MTGLSKHLDFGMELLSEEQARDLDLYASKEITLERLEMANAPQDKLASFMALFEK